MRRLRGGAAFRIAPPPVLLAVGAGWIGIAAALAFGFPRHLPVAAGLSAAAAWLAAVLLVLAGEELVEAITRRDDVDSRPDQRGWRRPYGPLLAIAAGLGLGYALWR